MMIIAGLAAFLYYIKRKSLDQLFKENMDIEKKKEEIKDETKDLSDKDLDDAITRKLNEQG